MLYLAVDIDLLIGYAFYNALKPLRPFFILAQPEHDLFRGPNSTAYVAIIRPGSRSSCIHARAGVLSIFSTG
jgi:hypothetical protein